MKFTIQQVAAILNGKVEGNGAEEITSLAKIQDAQKGSISFLSNLKYEEFIYTTGASAVIVSEDFVPKKELKTTLIRVKDSYSSFTVLLEEYHKIMSYAKQGVENPSFIGENSQVGEKVYRGAFSYIGNNVKIGDNVKIYPQAFIGDNVVIGDNSIIHPGVKICENTVIGKRCVIHPGAVIGSDGFGFAPQEDGSYKTIPQLGNVILEDDVSIGANSALDCATLGSTIIRKGTKIDNLIQIAHNVEIGSNTVMAAQAGVSGSTTIGDNCMIGGQVGIAGHIKIGNKVMLAAQTGVMKSMEDGEVGMGSPAQSKGDYFKSVALFRKLPDLRRRIEQLEEKVLNLRAN